MGLLDRAIREHLELKRRCGADPGELARVEREALQPLDASEPPSWALGPAALEPDELEPSALGPAMGEPSSLGAAVPFDGAAYLEQEGMAPSGRGEGTAPGAPEFDQDTLEIDMDAVLAEAAATPSLGDTGAISARRIVPPEQRASARGTALEPERGRLLEEDVQWEMPVRAFAPAQARTSDQAAPTIPPPAY